MSPVATATAVHAPQVGTVDGDHELLVLTGLLDAGFLDEIGWDPSAGVLRVPAEHPLLGYRLCRVPGCVTMIYAYALGICRACSNRLQVSGQNEEEFLANARTWRTVGTRFCAVTDCARPAKTARAALCRAHDYQRRDRLKVSMDNFLRHPDVQPLPSWGPCRVVACVREQDTERTPYCCAHRMQVLRVQRKSADFDEDHWRRTAPAVAEGGMVSLRGLPPLVVTQVLYGLQRRTESGAKTTVTSLRRVCDRLREEQVTSVGQATGITSTGLRPLWSQLVTFARQALLDPESERHKDLWDTAAFGYGGSLDFTKIRQHWIREAAKRWAAEDLPRRRGDQVVGIVQSHINSLVLLSESLHATRHQDHGHQIGEVGRPDIVAFLNRLAYLEKTGKLSAYGRLVHCRNVRKMLNTCRALGLTRTGNPLAGLADDFTVRQQDLPPAPQREEPGRDLPPEVVRQLCDALPRLDEITSREMRVAIEVLIDTGRRPDEICELAWDCLAWDTDSQPVLVYDNWKEQRMGRRLPIPRATAELITGQKKRVRERFPDALLAELKLLPSAVKNPHGKKAISDGGLTGRHREWVNSLPPLLLADGTEFDKSAVVPYAYRHTYAQRHADAGVPADVLRDLMDHQSMDVTKGYYRVGEQRRRSAVDKVAAMQFDRHGNRAWRQAKALLDTEHTRRAIGEVAVPFGTCNEPSNVQAGGDHCPIRFRCVGCDHFRTDISYLPELQAYLDDLLRSRERLAAMTEADAWAKAEAMPSDEEITRVRRLIRRVKEDLDGLSAEDRDQVDKAIAVVRKNRAVHLGMPRVRQPLPDIRPERPA
ncbi:tyrosine-type recombinase/integrase [Streptomyces sp. NPDC002784]